MGNPFDLFWVFAVRPTLFAYDLPDTLRQEQATTVKNNQTYTNGGMFLTTYESSSTLFDALQVFDSAETLHELVGYTPAVDVERICMHCACR